GLRGAGAAFGAGAGAGGGASAAGAGVSGGGASAGRPRMRRFFTSTTTVFERPWLKLCFTFPVSTVRLSPSGGRVPSFGFSVWSAILFLRQYSSAEGVLKAGSPPFRPRSGPVKARHLASAGWTHDAAAGSVSRHRHHS